MADDTTKQQQFWMLVIAIIILLIFLYFYRPFETYLVAHIPSISRRANVSEGSGMLPRSASRRINASAADVPCGICNDDMAGISCETALHSSADRLKPVIEPSR